MLAGGDSRRMGEDKARVKLAGEPLLNRAIQSVQPLFEHLLISVRKPRDNLLFPQLCDRGEGSPMMGIATALENVNTPWVFVMACDMPFISARMIHTLSDYRASQQVVVAVVGDVMQPLAAFYAKSSLPLMRKHIESGDYRLKRMIDCVDATLIDEQEFRMFDPKLLSFMDLDNRQDVEKAEEILRSLA
ncbi:MAG: molybdenum cofactor guanylyltransferase [Mariprofundales bacterium]